MRKDEFLLEGEARIKALERLVERLGRDDLPDPVVNHLDPVRLWTAFSMDEEEYWGEVDSTSTTSLRAFRLPPVAARTVERLTRSRSST